MLLLDALLMVTVFLKTLASVVGFLLVPATVIAMFELGMSELR